MDNDHLIGLLNEIAEFLEDRSDVVDGPYGEPRPNRAMSLLGEVERALERLQQPQQPKKLLGFAAAVREYGDNWIFGGFQYNGESYRGMSPATVIAMQDSRGPDDADAHHMKNCLRWGVSTRYEPR